jgi:hypothetical protein
MLNHSPSINNKLPHVVEPCLVARAKQKTVDGERGEWQEESHVVRTIKEWDALGLSIGDAHIDIVRRSLQVR